MPASRLSHGGTATRGDIDGDGAVDSVDIALLLSAWGTADIRADLDGSGQVGSADITILLANWTG